jgi:glycosyltransferase involved in cell wall biosynthesis
MHKKINSELNIAVLMLSYNSEEYIEEAVSSFLKQKGVKNWKLYVADDFSTDNTREIILKYKQSFPDRIDCFFNDKNLGIARNLFTNYLKLNSKYALFIAADDIVEDHFFLKDSYNILEKNKSLSFTYTNGYKFFEKNKDLKEKINCPEPIRNPFSIKEWTENSMFYINVRSILFRTKNYPKEFEEWVYNTKAEDFIHRIFILLAGKGYYQKKYSTLYRVREKGKQNQIDNNNEQLYFNSLKTMKGLNEFAQKNYSIKYFNNFFGQHMRISIIFLGKKMIFKSLVHFIITFRYKSTLNNRFILFKTLIKTFLNMQKPKF